MVIWLYVVIYPTVFHLFLLVLHRFFHWSSIAFLFTSVTVVACVTVDMCHGRHLSNLLFSIPRFVGIACPWGQLNDSMCDGYHGGVDYYWLVRVGWWLFLLLLQLC